MYVRVVTITAQSKMQFDMLVAYFENIWSPKVIKLGAISAEMVKISDNSGIYIIHYADEVIALATLNEIKQDVDEVKAQSKVHISGGDRIFRIDG
ncbi:MAG: hypothetical protein ACI85H_001453 [Paracoccaceae bacterium]|jgi:hypothetical protein